MIEPQVRTHYGSLDAASLGIGANAKSRAKSNARPTNESPPQKSTQGPGFTTYVVSPTTLLAAQEARETDKIRRDDQQKNTHQSGSQADDKKANTHGELTPEEQEQVQTLKKIDREVRAHERAHRAAGGTLTGAAQYTYVRGPDGQMYAVSGEVSIDTGRESSAAATVEKMEAVIRAALAPANPSSQDLAVAAKARQVLNQVSEEAREERLNLEDDNTPQSALSQIQVAHRAYRSGGAQNGPEFLAEQARDDLIYSTQQSLNLVI